MWNARYAFNLKECKDEIHRLRMSNVQLEHLNALLRDELNEPTEV